MSCHAVPYRVMSYCPYHVVSCHIMPHHVSNLVMSYILLNYPNILCHVTLSKLCHVVPCNDVSIVITVSYLLLNYLMLCYLGFNLRTYPKLVQEEQTP